MSRAEADEALSRLRADGDAFAAALMELEDHPGRRFLEGTASAGTTLDRWTAAKAAIGGLWERLGRYRAIVRQAGETDELAEVSALVRGPAAELAAAITTGLSAVTEVVAAAERIWSEYVPWLDRMDERLRAATATELGDAALSRLIDEVTELRTRVFSDPLSLPADDGRIARLTAELDTVRREIDELASLRRERDVEVAGLRGTLEWLSGVERRAREVTALARAKISTSLGDVPDAAAVLVRRLDQVAATEDLRRLAAGLAQLRTSIDAALERAHQAEENARGLLDRRSELRGRLDAYRVKAARLGHSEDAGLAELHRQAHSLLWSAPCDLAVATAAVLAYQEAVNDKGNAR